MTVRPGDNPETPQQSDEHGLVAEPHLSSLPTQEKTVYTLPEKQALAVHDVFGQKPEYSGRYCSLCNDTTAHFRPRGKAPNYEKSVHWNCSVCFMPGGKLYELVKSLMVRQGEIAK